MRKYPNIERACFMITVANGGLNRFRNEESVRKEIHEWLEKQKEEGYASSGLFNAPRKYDFFEIDRWIGTLSEDDLNTVTDGEMTEADTIVASAPAGTRELLDYYFDEVC